MLALGRSNPLKNLPLTIDGWRALPAPAARAVPVRHRARARRASRACATWSAPSDEEVNELFNQAAVFVQTSTHEGFALPPLEAMATGGAVVCTDAHGNRDFCVDGENCLMPEPTPEAVAAALRRLIEDPQLRERLGQAGIATAQDYAWERRIDALEGFLGALARPAARPARGARCPIPQAARARADRPRGRRGRADASRRVALAAGVSGPFVCPLRVAVSAAPAASRLGDQPLVLGRGALLAHVLPVGVREVQRERRRIGRGRCRRVLSARGVPAGRAGAARTACGAAADAWQPPPASGWLRASSGPSGATSSRASGVSVPHSSAYLRSASSRSASTWARSSAIRDATRAGEAAAAQ